MLDCHRKDKKSLLKIKYNVYWSRVDFGKVLTDAVWKSYDKLAVYENKLECFEFMKYF